LTTRRDRLEASLKAAAAPRLLDALLAEVATAGNRELEGAE
jgi:hypothetical protein